jgi:hypothetical protein
MCLVAVVRLARAAFPGAQLEVLIEKLVHRRARARLAQFVDLVEQPRPRRGGETARLGSRRNQLDEIASAAGDRVRAGVDHA